MYEPIGKVVYWIAAGFGLALIGGGLGWSLYKITLYFGKQWIKCMEEWTSIPVLRRACKAIRRFKASKPSVCPFCNQVVPEDKTQEGANRP